MIDLPPKTNIETATSTYKNGMLEIVFGKKKQSEHKGKQINLESRGVEQMILLSV